MPFSFLATVSDSTEWRRVMKTYIMALIVTLMLAGRTVVAGAGFSPAGNESYLGH